MARCIVRLIDPTEGSIRISGTEVADISQRTLKPHRKKVQIVFQDPFRSLNPRIEVGGIDHRGADQFRRARASRPWSARAS